MKTYFIFLLGFLFGVIATTLDRIRNERRLRGGDKVSFANDDQPRQTIISTFANEMEIKDDGWAQLAPFGDFPGKAVMVVDGVPHTFQAIQRLDKQSAEMMLRAFNSPINRVKRFFKSIPIYEGHPDAPDRGGQYPNKVPVGSITDVAIREDGFYCKPSFFPVGAALVQSKKLYPSARWASEFSNEEENGLKIFRPSQLVSAGLTEHPKLPVEWLNEAEDVPKPVTKNQNTEMKITDIIAALAAYGVTLANDATEPQAIDGIHQLGRKANTVATIANDKNTLDSKLTAANGTIGTLTTDLNAARVSFSNEREKHIGTILKTAITRGQITEVEKPDWERRLKVEATFSNEAEAIAKLEPKLKTKPLNINVGERKVSVSNESDRRDVLAELISTKMKGGASYDEAFAAVQKEQPALFAAMKQPDQKA